MNIKETGDLSDDGELDSFITSYHYTTPDTKIQRIVKTYLINFSFIALVSKLLYIHTFFNIIQYTNNLYNHISMIFVLFK